MKTLKRTPSKSKIIIFFSLLFFLTTFISAVALTSGEDRLLVDQDLCMGCGKCEEVAPDCFIVLDEKATVLLGWIWHPIQFTEAMEVCPTSAIYLESR